MQTTHHQHTANDSRGWTVILDELDRIARDAEFLGEGLDAAVEVIGARLACPLGFVYVVNEDGGLECRSVWVAGSGRRPMPAEPRPAVDFSLPLAVLATGTGQWCDLGANGETGGRRRQAYAFPVLGVEGVVAVLELVGERPVARLEQLHMDAHLMGVLLGRLADASRVTAAVAAERRRIGRELHDSIGQQLSGLGMLARGMANAPHIRRQELRDRLDLLATGLREAHAEVRELSHGLTAAQGTAPLAEALASFSERATRQCGAVCRFTGDASVEVENGAAATHLLRIAQEAYSNAVRHGHARAVQMDLRQGGGEVTLEIRDDGRGFPAGDGMGDGIGLANMRDRARQVGGTLRVRSDTQSGTVVTCSLPEGAH